MENKETRQTIENELQKQSNIFGQLSEIVEAEYQDAMLYKAGKKSAEWTGKGIDFAVERIFNFFR